MFSLLMSLFAFCVAFGLAIGSLAFAAYNAVNGNTKGAVIGMSFVVVAGFLIFWVFVTGVAAQWIINMPMK